MDTITHAAVACSAGIFSVQLPWDHREAWRNAQRAPQTQSVSLCNAVEGYLTSAGEFVTKAEAMAIALAAGQITRPPAGEMTDLEVAYMRISGQPPEGER